MMGGVETWWFFFVLVLIVPFDGAAGRGRGRGVPILARLIDQGALSAADGKLNDILYPPPIRFIPSLEESFRAYATRHPFRRQLLNNLGASKENGKSRFTLEDLASVPYFNNFLKMEFMKKNGETDTEAKKATSGQKPSTPYPTSTAKNKDESAEAFKEKHEVKTKHKSTTPKAATNYQGETISTNTKEEKTEAVTRNHDVQSRPQKEEVQQLLEIESEQNEETRNTTNPNEEIGENQQESKIETTRVPNEDTVESPNAKEFSKKENIGRRRVGTVKKIRRVNEDRKQVINTTDHDIDIPQTPQENNENAQVENKNKIAEHTKNKTNAKEETQETDTTKITNVGEGNKEPQINSNDHKIEKDLSPQPQIEENKKIDEQLNANTNSKTEEQKPTRSRTRNVRRNSRRRYESLPANNSATEGTDNKQRIHDSAKIEERGKPNLDIGPTTEKASVHRRRKIRKYGQLEIMNRRNKEINRQAELKHQEIEEMNRQQELRNREIDEMNRQIELKNREHDELIRQQDLKNREIDAMNRQKDEIIRKKELRNRENEEINRQQEVRDRQIEELQRENEETIRQRELGKITIEEFNKRQELTNKQIVEINSQKELNNRQIEEINKQRELKNEEVTKSTKIESTEQSSFDDNEEIIIPTPPGPNVDITPKSIEDTTVSQISEERSNINTTANIEENVNPTLDIKPTKVNTPEENRNISTTERAPLQRRRKIRRNRPPADKNKENEEINRQKELKNREIIRQQELRNREIEEMNRQEELKNREIEEINRQKELKSREYEETIRQQELKNREIEEVNRRKELKNRENVELGSRTNEEVPGENRQIEEILSENVEINRQKELKNEEIEELDKEQNLKNRKIEEIKSKNEEIIRQQKLGKIKIEEVYIQQDLINRQIEEFNRETEEINRKRELINREIEEFNREQELKNREIDEINRKNEEINRQKELKGRENEEILRQQELKNRDIEELNRQKELENRENEEIIRRQELGNTKNEEIHGEDMKGQKELKIREIEGLVKEQELKNRKIEEIKSKNEEIIKQQKLGKITIEEVYIQQDLINREIEQINREIEEINRKKELINRDIEEFNRQQEFKNRDIDEINRKNEEINRQKELKNRINEELIRQQELRNRQIEEANRENEELKSKPSVSNNEEIIIHEKRNRKGGKGRPKNPDTNTNLGSRRYTQDVLTRAKGDGSTNNEESSNLKIPHSSSSTQKRKRTQVRRRKGESGATGLTKNEDIPHPGSSNKRVTTQVRRRKGGRKTVEIAETQQDSADRNQNIKVRRRKGEHEVVKPENEESPPQNSHANPSSVELIEDDAPKHRIKRGNAAENKGERKLDTLKEISPASDKSLQRKIEESENIDLSKNEERESTIPSHNPNPNSSKEEEHGKNTPPQNRKVGKDLEEINRQTEEMNRQQELRNRENEEKNRQQELKNREIEELNRQKELKIRENEEIRRKEELRNREIEEMKRQQEYQEMLRLHELRNKEIEEKNRENEEMARRQELRNREIEEINRQKELKIRENEEVIRQQELKTRDNEEIIRQNELKNRTIEEINRQQELNIRQIEEINRENEGIIRQKELKSRENEEIIRQEELKNREHEEINRENEEIIRQKEIKNREMEEINREKELKSRENEEIIRQQELKNREIEEMIRQVELKNRTNEEINRHQELGIRQIEEINRENEEVIRKKELKNREREEIVRQEELKHRENEEIIREKELQNREDEEKVRQKESDNRQKEETDRNTNLDSSSNKQNRRVTHVQRRKGRYEVTELPENDEAPPPHQNSHTNPTSEEQIKTDAPKQRIKRGKVSISEEDRKLDTLEETSPIRKQKIVSNMHVRRGNEESLNADHSKKEELSNHRPFRRIKGMHFKPSEENSELNTNRDASSSKQQNVRRRKGGLKTTGLTKNEETTIEDDNIAEMSISYKSIAARNNLHTQEERRKYDKETRTNPPPYKTAHTQNNEQNEEKLINLDEEIGAIQERHIRNKKLPLPYKSLAALNTAYTEDERNMFKEETHKTKDPLRNKRIKEENRLRKDEKEGINLDEEIKTNTKQRSSNTRRGQRVRSMKYTSGYKQTEETNALTTITSDKPIEEFLLQKESERSIPTQHLSVPSDILVEEEFLIREESRRNAHKGIELPASRKESGNEQVMRGQKIEERRNLDIPGKTQTEETNVTTLPHSNSDISILLREENRSTTDILSDKPILLCEESRSTTNTGVSTQKSDYLSDKGLLLGEENLGNSQTGIEASSNDEEIEIRLEQRNPVTLENKDTKSDKTNEEELLLREESGRNTNHDISTEPNTAQQRRKGMRGQKRFEERTNEQIHETAATSLPREEIRRSRNNGELVKMQNRVLTGEDAALISREESEERRNLDSKSNQQDGIVHQNVNPNTKLDVSGNTPIEENRLIQEPETKFEENENKTSDFNTRASNSEDFEENKRNENAQEGKINEAAIEDTKNIATASPYVGDVNISRRRNLNNRGRNEERRNLSSSSTTRNEDAISTARDFNRSVPRNTQNGDVNVSRRRNEERKKLNNGGGEEDRIHFNNRRGEEERRNLNNRGGEEERRKLSSLSTKRNEDVSTTSDSNRSTLRNTQNVGENISPRRVEESGNTQQLSVSRGRKGGRNLIAENEGTLSSRTHIDRSVLGRTKNEEVLNRGRNSRNKNINGDTATFEENKNPSTSIQPVIRGKKEERRNLGEENEDTLRARTHIDRTTAGRTGNEQARINRGRKEERRNTSNRNINKFEANEDSSSNIQHEELSVIRGRKEERKNLGVLPPGEARTHINTSALRNMQSEEGKGEDIKSHSSSNTFEENQGVSYSTKNEEEPSNTFEENQDMSYSTKNEEEPLVGSSNVFEENQGMLYSTKNEEEPLVSGEEDERRKLSAPKSKENEDTASTATPDSSNDSLTKPTEFEENQSVARGEKENVDSQTETVPIDRKDEQERRNLRISEQRENTIPATLNPNKVSSRNRGVIANRRRNEESRSTQNIAAAEDPGSAEKRKEGRRKSINSKNEGNEETSIRNEERRRTRNKEIQKSRNVEGSTIVRKGRNKQQNEESDNTRNGDVQNNKPRTEEITSNRQRGRSKNRQNEESEETISRSSKLIRKGEIQSNEENATAPTQRRRTSGGVKFRPTEEISVEISTTSKPKINANRNAHRRRRLKNRVALLVGKPTPAPDFFRIIPKHLKIPPPGVRLPRLKTNTTKRSKREIRRNDENDFQQNHVPNVTEDQDRRRSSVRYTGRGIINKHDKGTHFKDVQPLKKENKQSLQSEPLDVARRKVSGKVGITFEDRGRKNDGNFDAKRSSLIEENQANENVQSRLNELLDVARRKVGGKVRIAFEHRGNNEGNFDAKQSSMIEENQAKDNIESRRNEPLAYARRRGNRKDRIITENISRRGKPIEDVEENKVTDSHEKYHNVESKPFVADKNRKQKKSATIEDNKSSGFSESREDNSSNDHSEEQDFQSREDSREINSRIDSRSRKNRIEDPINLNRGKSARSNYSVDHDTVEVSYDKIEENEEGSIGNKRVIPNYTTHLEGEANFKSAGKISKRKNYKPEQETISPIYKTEENNRRKPEHMYGSRRNHKIEEDTNHGIEDQFESTKQTQVKENHNANIGRNRKIENHIRSNHAEGTVADIGRKLKNTAEQGDEMYVSHFSRKQDKEGNVISKRRKANSRTKQVDETNKIEDQLATGNKENSERMWKISERQIRRRLKEDSRIKSKNRVEEHGSKIMPTRRNIRTGVDRRGYSRNLNSTIEETKFANDKIDDESNHTIEDQNVNQNIEGAGKKSDIYDFENLPKINHAVKEETVSKNTYSFKTEPEVGRNLRSGAYLSNVFDQKDQTILTFEQNFPNLQTVDYRPTLWQSAYFVPAYPVWHKQPPNGISGNFGLAYNQFGQATMPHRVSEVMKPGGLFQNGAGIAPAKVTKANLSFEATSTTKLNKIEISTLHTPYAYLNKVTTSRQSNKYGVTTAGEDSEKAEDKHRRTTTETSRIEESKSENHRTTPRTETKKVEHRRKTTTTQTIPAINELNGNENIQTLENNRKSTSSIKPHYEENYGITTTKIKTVEATIPRVTSDEREHQTATLNPNIQASDEENFGLKTSTPRIETTIRPRTSIPRIKTTISQRTKSTTVENRRKTTAKHSRKTTVNPNTKTTERGNKRRTITPSQDLENYPKTTEDHRRTTPTPTIKTVETHPESTQTPSTNANEVETTHIPNRKTTEVENKRKATKNRRIKTTVVGNNRRTTPIPKSKTTKAESNRRTTVLNSRRKTTEAENYRRTTPIPGNNRRSNQTRRSKTTVIENHQIQTDKYRKPTEIKTNLRATVTLAERSPVTTEAPRAESTEEGIRRKTEEENNFRTTASFNYETTERNHVTVRIETNDVENRRTTEGREFGDKKARGHNVLETQKRRKSSIDTEIPPETLKIEHRSERASSLLKKNEENKLLTENVTNRPGNRGSGKWKPEVGGFGKKKLVN